MTQTAPRTAALATWCSLSPDEVRRNLESRDQGLSASEAAARLATHGPNVLPSRPPTALWQIVLRQFRSPLIYVLGLAALVSLLIGDATDAGFIAGVLVLNAALGSWQEWKAEQSSHALKRLLRISASVQRDGEVREIGAEGVVPGDVVWLESGNRVPADIRLLTAHGLEIDESLLTGESLPVAKEPDWIGEESTPLADRRNMAYAGSIVTRGRAKGFTVATGTGTSVGQLALDVLEETGGKAPLLLRMERFTRMIAVLVLIAAGLVGILGATLGGHHWSEMFLFAVALAVSAIPEGLPVAMTVALAVATTRMARRGLIVRRLTAVEGLGSCTLIATDKTGTLTCNALTVRQARTPGGKTFEVSGEGFIPVGTVVSAGAPVASGSDPELEDLVRASVLCNEAELHARNGDWTWRGDTVDVALLSLARKLDRTRESALDLHPQVSQIPFEPENQYAASFHRVDDGVKVFVKGAPERILAMCAPPCPTAEWDGVARTMAERGFRVLALADGTLAQALDPHQAPPAPSALRFLGLVGMIDPLRPGVREAVRSCRKAGVAVSMVTGDHRQTALAIARDLDLAGDESETTTGAELLATAPEGLPALLARTRVFARVSPRQKLQVVEAARAAGHFVAVTGDGVNDAPALRVANIGIAMGKSGTDVAREASDLVISNDDFPTIVAGIEEGRVAYDNIRKVIYLLISTGAAEVVLMVLSVSTGIAHLPLLPVQLLWLNLVTNGIQDVALAFEPNEGDVLQRQPRPPRERIFNRLMVERTVIAAVWMGVVAFVTFQSLLPDDASESEVQGARNSLLLLMVLFESIHIGNCRSETKSALRLSPLRSPILLVGAAIALLVHVGAMYTPAGRALLDIAPIDARGWATTFALALTIFPVMELHKWSWKRRNPPPPEAGVEGASA